MACKRMPTPCLCEFHGGGCVNKLACSRHCPVWLPRLPAEKLAAAIQDLRKAEADRQKAMSQSAAANREADKLTQKLYKMPKARLLAGPQADCCVLCWFLKQQRDGPLLHCALRSTVCCPHHICCHGQVDFAAQPADAHYCQAEPQDIASGAAPTGCRPCTPGHQPGQALLIMLHPASRLQQMQVQLFVMSGGSRPPPPFISPTISLFQLFQN